MLRWNLSTKVVVAYSGLIALMAGVLTTTLYWQLRLANHKAMNDRLSDLLSLTAPEIDSDYHSLTLTPKDKNKPYYKINLRKLQTVQANSKDINRIYTLRPKKSGELAFVLNFSPKSKKSISVGETVQNLTPILAAEASTLSKTKIENDFLQNPEGETVLYGYTPIKDQFGRLEGILAIELDASSIVQTELIGGVIALGTFLVILALTVLIVNWLARSLIVNRTLRLNDAAKKLAAGDWHQSLATESEDELGELAKSFDYMAQQLQNSFKKLEEYSQNLEQKVKERTTELQEKNQHLQQTQLQLIQAEKMSALGQMVAGIAHEINNPVGFITSNISHTREYFQYLLDLLSLYEQECPHPSPVLQSQMEAIDLNFLKDDLDKLLLSMKTGCDRIRQVVLGLRNFSRLDESAQKQVNIHEGLDNTLVILQHRLAATGIRPAITINKSYEKLPLVNCYANQLNQVFLNILTNAIDALDISQAEYSPEITIKTALHDPQTIQITIADNGVGINETVVQKIFDPFFTTKPIGKGTGLGLSISHQIVTQMHGGQLHCLSQVGRGTEFMIRVPINVPTM